MAGKKAVKKLLPEDFVPVMPQPPRPFPLRKAALAVIVIGLLAIFFTNKGIFIAATVNGKPIFRWQLTKVLTSRFGQQALDTMISQAIVEGEARKAGIAVSSEDIAKKEAEVIQSLGGSVSIDEILKYQGMTKSDFEEQLRLQITVEKLLGKDIVITNEDIAQYIATNQAFLTATTEAALIEEARQALFSDQVNEKLRTWFSEIRTKAKILRFL